MPMIDVTYPACCEIAEGSWGAGGQIVRFAQLREMAAAARA